MPDFFTSSAASREDLSAILHVLEQFHPLPSGIEEFFEKNVRSLRVPNKKILLREGEICRYIFFIVKGAVRGYMKVGRREITTWIVVENELVTSIASLTKPMPVMENIQAVEECELLALPFNCLEEMYERFPEMNITIRKILQLYYWQAELRAFIARLTNAEKKYHYFLERQSHLANRIQLKYIASYLGMTVETLSRIRRKMSSA